MGLIERLKETTQAGEKAQPAGEGLGRLRRREIFLLDIRRRVHEMLIHEIGVKMDQSKIPSDGEIHETIYKSLDSVLGAMNQSLSHREREDIIAEVSNEVLGYGPIEPFIQDPTVDEIMVNGPRFIYVERAGIIEKTDRKFLNDEHVMRIIEKIVAPLGRRIDETSPMVDARLKDGSRVNAVIPPLALCGPTLTIRKFSKRPYTAQDLVRFGTLSDDMAKFLEACVKARLNMVVSGGTGSGKTTTLNVLSSFIPDNERIITIEDAAELQLQQEHVVPMESRPANIEQKGAVGIRDLVRNALRMRPDRIVVGEVRGGEALDMLQAMNTGHDGSVTTAHANSPRDVLSRLETMALMAGTELPVKAVRDQIAGAVDLLVHQERMQDGRRRVTHITEVRGIENDTFVLKDIFEFHQTGMTQQKGVEGEFRPLGVRPGFMDRFRLNRIELSDEIFNPAKSAPRAAKGGEQYD